MLREFLWLHDAYGCTDCMWPCVGYVQVQGTPDHFFSTFSPITDDHICLAAEGTVVPPFYTAVNSTNNTFLLQLGVQDQSLAEMMCTQKCGHLAAYVNQAEQAEVEIWYTTTVGGLGWGGLGWSILQL